MEDVSVDHEPIYDHHLHFFHGATLMDTLSLSGMASKEEVMRSLAALTSELSIVMDWKDSHIQFDKGELDDLSPMAIFNVSFHGCLVNEPGKRFLVKKHRIPREHLDAPMGTAANSGLTGLIREKMLCFDKSKGEAFLKQLEAAGICGFDDMGFRSLTPDIEAFILDRTDCCFYVNTELARSIKMDNPGLFAKVCGVKCFMDGALGTRSAKVSTPYDNGSTGTAYINKHELRSSMEFAAESSKEVAIHAIGDAAIDDALEVTKALGKTRSQIPRIRIEHAQFISKASAQLTKEMGVVLSMQPNFSTDSVDYVDRLPEEFLAGNNPFRMLIDEVGFVPGKDLLFGSDGMPYGREPALRASFTPPLPSQVLSRSEFAAGHFGRRWPRELSTLPGENNQK